MAIIIVDPGSTHMGKLEYALEHIELAARSGAQIIKFQLFSNPPNYTGGNIELPLEWWPILQKKADENGIELTASVFNADALAFLIAQKPKFIKFSYSNKHQKEWIEAAIGQGIKPIVSCDVMTDQEIVGGVIKLYCIPEYPVRYEIAFDGIFPRFDGFYDHSLNIRQTLKAIHAGAKYIEKHTTLAKEDVKCPDANFAVSYSEIANLISY